MVKCVVNLLDGEKFETQLLAKSAAGKDLFDNVKEKLSLSEEADYFSISYKEPKSQIRRWVDMEKRIDKQMDGGQQQPYEFSFELKFYPPVPENLNEDLTRYFIVLQIRKDLWTGILPASFHTLAILGSYTVQSELGDFDKNLHFGVDYLRPYSFAPQTTDELLYRIAELHRSHRGMTPAEADLYFLQTAKRMALYGMDMNVVKDNKGNKLSIGIAASGLYLYEGKLRMDTFKWHRMLKMSYKAESFLIKVRPAEYEKHEKVLALKLPNRKEAKRLLRTAVEHHQFFRLNQPEPVDSNTFGTFGSRRWRMSGRTAAQLKNTGTPKRGDPYSRSDSYLSQDTHLGGMDGRGGTLPMHMGSREMDKNRVNPYGTYGGHRSEKYLLGHDEQGNPIYGDYLNDSTLTKGADSSMLAPPPGPGDGRYLSADDLLTERGYDATTGQMTDNAMTIDRRENGAMVPPPPNEYESYDDIMIQQQQAQALAAQQQAQALAAQQQAQLSQQPQYPPGVGDLPLPYFSSQSAGVASNGAIDLSYPLATMDRSEKKLRERDTKLKNPRMTVDTTASIDDQLLLDAILAVTGLDPRLNVDKVLIKTEEQP